MLRNRQPMLPRTHSMKETMPAACHFRLHHQVYLPTDLAGSCRNPYRLRIAGSFYPYPKSLKPVGCGRTWQAAAIQAAQHRRPHVRIPLSLRTHRTTVRLRHCLCPCLCTKCNICSVPQKNLIQSKAHHMLQGHEALITRCRAGGLLWDGIRSAHMRGTTVTSNSAVCHFQGALCGVEWALP